MYIIIDPDGYPDGPSAMLAETYDREQMMKGKIIVIHASGVTRYIKLDVLQRTEIPSATFVKGLL